MSLLALGLLSRAESPATAGADYLQWMVEKSELEEGVKHGARYWLALARNTSAA